MPQQVGAAIFAKNRISKLSWTFYWMQKYLENQGNKQQTNAKGSAIENEPSFFYRAPIVFIETENIFDNFTLSIGDYVSYGVDICTSWSGTMLPA